jgi:membrane protease YdiL (CAAX protease family)
MSASGRGPVPRAERQALPARWPVLAPLALFGSALLLRLFDIFVARLDERLGELILSKALGFALIVGYTWWVGQRVAAIGLHTRHLGPALALGAGITVAAFVIAGTVQLVVLESGATYAIQALDPKTGMAGGSAFAAWLIAGNVVNSFMEEGLFRGIMLPHFLQRWRFRTANVLQAALFAAWHLVWPLKAYLTGDVSAAGTVAQAGSLLLGTFVAGLVYGYLSWRTDSLWAPWIAHLLHNTTLNLMQVRGSSGDLQPAVVLSVVVVIALACLALAIAPLAKRLTLPRLRPWNASTVTSVTSGGRVEAGIAGR